MINKAIIIGYLGRDPEIRYTQGGKGVCTMSVGTTRRWRDSRSSHPQEETTWLRVIAWGHLGESCHAHLTKGRQIYVEGRIHVSTYTKDGVKRYATEIIADTVQFLGSAQGNSHREDGAVSQVRANNHPTDDDGIQF